MRSFTPFLFLLTGCDVLMQKFGELDSFSNSFIVDGIYMGTPVVESEVFTLPSSGFASEAQISLHLSHASIEGDLSAIPIGRATISLTSDSLSSFVVPESEDGGAYLSTAQEGLPYPAGEYVTIDIEQENGMTHQIGIEAPIPPTFELPSSHGTSQSLSIDLSDQGYYESFVIVMRADTGEVTYQKLPSDIEEFYQYAHPNDTIAQSNVEYIQEIEIPGSAFPTDNVYAIGVAGIQSSLQEDMIDVNTLVSSLLAGQFRFQEFCVPDCQAFPLLEQ